MQINQLPTIPQAPADSDVLAIEVNGITYKVSKQALAAAIAANITPADIGALPSSTTFVSGVKGSKESSYRSGNVNLTPANIGALPNTTAAADIGASATFALSNDYITAVTIYGVLSTMARGSVATIVTRTDASNAMCGVSRDMYGTIWRNPSSSSNNFYLSMTSTSGDVQYCYVLTLTESSMSHGTVRVYTPSN